MESKTILIVEDDITVSLMLRRFLESANYNVSNSSTMSEARKILYLISPDIVFLDMNLPDGKGLDLLPVLRQNHDCFIIAMSGNQQFMLESLKGRFHADVFLSKPFKFKIIKKTLKLVKDEQEFRESGR